MSADLQLVATTWNALQPLVGEEKCSGCECLQGALVELKLTLEELPDGPEPARLLSDIGTAMQVRATHGCLGCQPCNPGDILANFYRQQQAQASAAQPGCDAG
jgi:hypothetical protein